MVSTGEDHATVEQLIITVNGVIVEHDIINNLFEARIESTLESADMFELVFRDDELNALETGPFEIGASVKLEFETKDETFQVVVTGEITAIEPEYDVDYVAFLVVRGYDKTHRLNRGAISKAFVDVTDDDIMNQIAADSGLGVQIDSTVGGIRAHVFQDNQSGLAFIQQLARSNGFQAYVEDDTLKVVKTTQDRGEVTLDWGTSLRSFHVKMSVAGQVDQVMVKGWDPQTKTAIVGNASSSEVHPVVSVGGSGGDVASSKLESAIEIEVRRPVNSQGQADAIAQSLLDEINAKFIEAEGVAEGSPKIVAGCKIKIENLGSKFSGTYVVSAARHIYSTEGYKTEIFVTGSRPRLEAELISGASIKSNDGDRWHGVYPAIVTDIDDPDNLGRVKIKYPWMDDTIASGFARVAMAGAGNERGLHWIPEINDEVLVAFEQGDVNFPYILGGLYNGTDTQPETESVKEGKVEVRTIKTREGHVLRFVDEEGKQKIHIEDAQAKNTITLVTDGDGHNDNTPGINITSTGTIDIAAAVDFTESVKGAVEFKSLGADMILSSLLEMDLMSAQSITLKTTSGAIKILAVGPAIIMTEKVTIKADGITNVISGGKITFDAGKNIKINGALVNINSPKAVAIATSVQSPTMPTPTDNEFLE